MSGGQPQTGRRQELEKRRCVRLAHRNAAAVTWELLEAPGTMGDARPRDPLTPADRQPVSCRLSATDMSHLTACWPQTVRSPKSPAQVPKSSAHLCACAKSFQLCPVLCDLMDRSPPSVHGLSTWQEYCSGLPALVQGIFPTQGLTLGLPHCRQIRHRLSHQRSPESEYSSKDRGHSGTFSLEEGLIRTRAQPAP